MRAGFYDLFGITLDAVVRGGDTIEEVFPALATFPRARRSAADWRVRASHRPWPPPPKLSGETRSLRVFDGAPVDYSVDPDGSIRAHTRGASVVIHRQQRTARLVYDRSSPDAARALGAVLLAEVLRCSSRYPVHAAALELDGGVVLVCGPSGAGKSTLAYAWAALGRVRFMADDQSVVHRQSGRIWASAVTGPIALLPEAESVLAGQHALRSRALADFDRKRFHPCNSLGMACREARPVRAIVQLHPAPGDGVSLCDDGAATQLLLTSSLYPGAPDLSRAHFDALVDLAAQAPTLLVPRAARIEETVRELERAIDDIPFLASPSLATGRRPAPELVARRAGRLMRPLVRLAAGHPVRPQARPLLPGDWTDLVALADHHGLLSLIGRRVELGGAPLDLPRSALVALRSATAHGRSAWKSARLAIDLVRRALDAAGISWCLVDGAAIAITCGDPEARPVSGLDLVVAPRSSHAARSELLHCGFLPEPVAASGPPPEEGGETALVSPAPAFCPVRVHPLRMADLPCSLPALAPSDVLRRAIDRGDARTRGTSTRPDQVAIAALRFVYGAPWRGMLHLLDICRLLGTAGAAERDEAFAHAKAVGAGVALHVALRSAGRFLTLPIPPGNAPDLGRRLRMGFLGAVAGTALGAAEPWRPATLLRRRIFEAIARSIA